jgi:hypothetical protein
MCCPCSQFKNVKDYSDPGTLHHHFIKNIHFLLLQHPSARTQGTVAPRCADDDNDYDEHGDGPRFAEYLVEVMALLHSTHLDHSAHQTLPWSWSGGGGGSDNLGPVRLSLGPPAPLPASAAAARSSTTPAWIRPLPTQIRRCATTARDDGLRAGVGRRRRSAGSPVFALCPLPR